MGIRIVSKKIKLFQNQKARTYWDEKNELWYFSIIDVIEILTESPRPRKYWNALKAKLINEGSQLSHDLGQLKMRATDGKMRLTDVANTKQLLRLIQSIPSKKAEPFKLWLAKVGNERIQEISDPEQSLNRARENWQKAGRSKKWIEKRMSGQETRNKLTDYWQENEVKAGKEFAILSNIIHSEWSGLSVADHKALKNLDSRNLRDNMSEAELLFTALAELSTRQIAETDEAKGLEQNKKSAKQGGTIAKNAKVELENKTHKKIVDSSNFLKPIKLIKK
ncbi:MAG: Bro-N domain-containing protein [Methylococcales symbiont of Hymedesmia sp. n. MRB-2018]|nr:MAG: Bro-N domain-containing protein [Methylococcales symbiont of Hymedesmia sp. n. MRB-2018]